MVFSFIYFYMPCHKYTSLKLIKTDTIVVESHSEFSETTVHVVARRVAL